jgi:WD40 repeat protein
MAKDQILRTLPDSLQGRGVSWSPDGEEVAYVGAKGRVSKLTKNGELRKTLSFTTPRSLFDIDWHPSKNLLLAVEEDIYLIDIDQDSLLATYDDGSKNKGILCCGWHASGEFFVTGDYGNETEGGKPSYLKYWSKAGTLLKRIKESKFEYRNVKWTRDGNIWRLQHMC